MFGGVLHFSSSAKFYFCSLFSKVMFSIVPFLERKHFNFESVFNFSFVSMKSSLGLYVQKIFITRFKGIESCDNHMHSMQLA